LPALLCAAVASTRLAARGGQGELFKRATGEDGLLSKHLDLKSAQEAKGRHIIGRQHCNAVIAE
jgi:hypothetical protein